MYPAIYWKKLIGQWFGSKYLLKAFLGCGAYGAVFRADEMIADRIIQTVAIKIVIVDRERLDQQIEELQLAVRLRHPHLINGITCEQGDVNGDLCLGLVMELADDSLESYLKVNQPPLTVGLVSTVVQHLSEGLAYIHNQGIIHRDLKPANILRVGEAWKLADFGIARSLQDGTSTYTNVSQQIGTASYMPPESYEGKISPVWDTWSLGIMTAQLLTGNHPFPAQTVLELMKMVLTDSPILSKDLGSPFREIVTGCLVKEPRDRWTAQQVLATLKPPIIQFATPSASHSPHPQISSRPQVLTLDLPSGVELEMIKIPAGSFLIGSADHAFNNIYETMPQYQVTLQEYYLGKYPVTQEQYQAVMGNNPSYFKGKDYTMPMPPFPPPGWMDKHKWSDWMDHCNHEREDWIHHWSHEKTFFPKNPVEELGWNDAKAFCRKLYEITGKKVRLPTEAEWEYGCRAGSQSYYCFGDDHNQLGDYAWYYQNSGIQTHPVGQKKPNAWGLYDMHGNVTEWCEDSHAEKPENITQNGNITWLSSDESCYVLRGGSWEGGEGNCRSEFRTRVFANEWGNYIHNSGFRLALSIS